MPLFSNEYQPSLNPYYTNFEQSPSGRDYIRYRDKLEGAKKKRDIGLGIGHTVGSVVLSLFGLGSVAQGIGKIEDVASKAGDVDAAKHEQSRLLTDYKQYQNQLPAGAVGNNNLGQRNQLSSFSDYWKNKDTNQLSTLLSGLLKPNDLNKISPAGGSAFNYQPNYGSETPETPQVDNMSMGATDTPISNETAPAVGDMGGQTIDVAGGGGVGMKKGGMVAYNGGGLLMPMGEDDIALVDTKNQKDTGVRVQKGEMLVVSKENLASLQRAIKKGDHKKVYNLMKEQMAEAPKVEDGKHGFVRGGMIEATDADGKPIVFEEDYKMPKTQEGIRERFDYLQNVLGKGGFSSLFKGTSVKSKDYEKAVQKLEDEYKRLAPVVAKSYKEKGVGKLPDDYLSNFSYQSGDLKKGETLKDSQVLANNYGAKDSSPMDAVWNGKQWVHAQGDNKGAPVDEKLQSELTQEYNKQASGVKYGIGSEGAVITPSKKTDETPTTPTTGQDGEAGGLLGSDIYGLQDTRQKEIPGENLQPKYTDELQPDLNKIQGGGVPQAEAQLPTSPDWQKYARFYAPEALGTGFDIYRAIKGFQGASTKLPTFQKGAAWGDYLNRLHSLSESGLTGNELSAAQRDIDSTYAYDVANVRNLSGGQSGLALGNLGRAATSHYGALANLAALNDEARARNLGQYGGALTEDINLNRMKFGDKYNEALWTKQAGAQLANDALKNMSERGNYIQSYAPNSYYDQLMQTQLKEKAQNERYARLANDYYAKNGFSAPAVGSLNFGG